MKPLGTVVKLLGDNNLVNDFKIIIVDRFIQIDQNSKEYYDYKGIFYPMGSIEDQKGLMFNDEDIKDIYHESYKDELDDKFVAIALRKLEEDGYVKK